MRKLKETVADVEWLVSEWDYDTNSALGIFPDKIGSQSNTYAFWKCKFGHKWKAIISNRYHGRGCPECRKQLKTSFPEQAVFFYIKKSFPMQSTHLEIFSPMAWRLTCIFPQSERELSMTGLHGTKMIPLKRKSENTRFASKMASRSSG